MSGIDEYILGACFIETKPKPLPWEKSKDDREEADESDSKTDSSDIYVDKGVNASYDSKDSCDQGIIAKGKAEDILTKITLGDLKLRDISFTCKQSKEIGTDDCRVNRIYDVGLEYRPLNMKQSAYTSNKLAEYSNSTTNSYYKLNCNSAIDVEMLKSRTSMPIDGTYGERCNATPFNDQTYSTKYKKSLVRERIKYNIPDIDPKDVGRISDTMVPNCGKLLEPEDGETSVAGQQLNGFQQTTDSTEDKCTDEDEHKNSSGTCAKERGVSIDRYWSKQFWKSNEALTNSKVECNTKLNLTRKSVEECSSNGFENVLNASGKITGGKVGVGEMKMYPYRRVELNTNVRATDLIGWDSRKDMKSVKAVGHSLKSNASKHVLFYPFDITNDTLLDSRTKDNARNPIIETKKSAYLRRKWEMALDVGNLHKDEVKSTTVKTKKKRKQREKQTRHKMNEAEKVQDNDDVFDIAPVKDTPWNPDQDESSEINNDKKKPDTESKTKTEKSSVKAKEFESKDGRSIQRSTGMKSSISQSIFKGIGYGNTYSETKQVKSKNMFRVVPVEQRRESLDFGIKDRSHETTPYLNGDIVTTHRSDKMSSDSLMNDTSNQTRRRKKKKKKIKKIDKREVLPNGNLDEVRNTVLQKNSMGSTDQSQDFPNDNSDTQKNIIDLNHPQNENRENEDMHSIQNIREDKPNTLQGFCQPNTALLPIIEEVVDCGSEDDLDFTTDGAEISQDNKSNLLEKHAEDANNSVSLFSLHRDCRACVGEIDTSVIIDTQNGVGTVNRASRWRRFINWIACCFKPKVDDYKNVKCYITSSIY